jgi:hypothetical protein
VADPHVLPQGEKFRYYLKMRIEVARIAAGLLQQRRGSFLRDETLPLPVRGMISVHLDTAWIPGFWSVAIRAAKPGNERFFDFPIGFAEDGTSWYFPARQWWLAHAQLQHPPNGSGCDTDAHIKYLSAEGTAHEFDYAAVLEDGTLKILEASDFKLECFCWQHAFRPSEEQP